MKAYINIIIFLLVTLHLGNCKYEQSKQTEKAVYKLSSLLESTASVVGQSPEQVYKTAENAIIRSRRGGVGGGRLRSGFKNLLDSLTKGEGKKFFDRMSDLFRRFLLAYVKAIAAENNNEPSGNSTSSVPTTSTTSSLTSTTLTSKHKSSKHTTSTSTQKDKDDNDEEDEDSEEEDGDDDDEGKGKGDKK